MTIPTPKRDAYSKGRLDQALLNVKAGVGWSSAKVLARYYGVSEKAIWDWARKGRLPEPKKLSHRNTRWSNAELSEHDKAIASLALRKELQPLYGQD